jgi:hypothetical protein
MQADPAGLPRLCGTRGRYCKLSRATPSARFTPIAFHVDDGPAARHAFVERLVELADVRLTLVTRNRSARRRT